MYHQNFYDPNRAGPAYDVSSYSGYPQMPPVPYYNEGVAIGYHQQIKTEEGGYKYIDDYYRGAVSHQNIPPTQPLYSCPFCATKCESTDLLLRHACLKHKALLANGQKWFIVSLNYHSAHAGVRKFKCSICMQDFVSLGSLEDHANHSHNNYHILYKGDSIVVEYIQYSNQKDVIDVNWSASNVQLVQWIPIAGKICCALCDYWSNVSWSLRNHLRQNHLINGEPGYILIKQGNLLQITFSSTENTVTSTGQDYVPSLTFVKNLRYYCCFCSLDFPTPYWLMKHGFMQHMGLLERGEKWYMHTFNASDLYAVNRFRCSLCQSMFYSFVDLREHAKLKHNNFVLHQYAGEIIALRFPCVDDREEQEQISNVGMMKSPHSLSAYTDVPMAPLSQHKPQPVWSGASMQHIMHPASTNLHAEHRQSHELLPVFTSQSQSVSPAVNSMNHPSSDRKNVGHTLNRGSASAVSNYSTQTVQSPHTVSYTEKRQYGMSSVATHLVSAPPSSSSGSSMDEVRIIPKKEPEPIPTSPPPVAKVENEQYTRPEAVTGSDDMPDDFFDMDTRSNSEPVVCTPPTSAPGSELEDELDDDILDSEEPSESIQKDIDELIKTEPNDLESVLAQGDLVKGVDEETSKPEDEPKPSCSSSSIRGPKTASYQCCFCPIKVSSTNLLLRHACDAHGSNLCRGEKWYTHTLNPATAKSVKLFTCLICIKVYGSFAELNVHGKAKHNNYILQQIGDKIALSTIQYSDSTTEHHAKALLPARSIWRDPAKIVKKKAKVGRPPGPRPALSPKVKTRVTVAYQLISGDGLPGYREDKVQYLAITLKDDLKELSQLPDDVYPVITNRSRSDIVRFKCPRCHPEQVFRSAKLYFDHAQQHQVAVEMMLVNSDVEFSDLDEDNFGESKPGPRASHIKARAESRKKEENEYHKARARQRLGVDEDSYESDISFDSGTNKERKTKKTGSTVGKRVRTAPKAKPVVLPVKPMKSEIQCIPLTLQESKTSTVALARLYKRPLETEDLCLVDGVGLFLVIKSMIEATGQFLVRFLLLPIPDECLETEPTGEKFLVPNWKLLKLIQSVDQSQTDNELFLFKAKILDQGEELLLKYQPLLHFRKSSLHATIVHEQTNAPRRLFTCANKTWINKNVQPDDIDFYDCEVALDLRLLRVEKKEHKRPFMDWLFLTRFDRTFTLSKGTYGLHTTGDDLSKDPDCPILSVQCGTVFRNVIVEFSFSANAYKQTRQSANIQTPYRDQMFVIVRSFGGEKDLKLYSIPEKVTTLVEPSRTLFLEKTNFTAFLKRIGVKPNDQVVVCIGTAVLETTEGFESNCSIGSAVFTRFQSGSRDLVEEVDPMECDTDVENENENNASSELVNDVRNSVTGNDVTNSVMGNDVTDRNPQHDASSVETGSYVTTTEYNAHRENEEFHLYNNESAYDVSQPQAEYGHGNSIAISGSGHEENEDDFVRLMLKWPEDSEENVDPKTHEHSTHAQCEPHPSHNVHEANAHIQILTSTNSTTTTTNSSSIGFQASSVSSEPGINPAPNTETSGEKNLEKTDNSETSQETAAESNAAPSSATENTTNTDHNLDADNQQNPENTFKQAETENNEKEETVQKESTVEKTETISNINKIARKACHLAYHTQNERECFSLLSDVQPEPDETSSQLRLLLCPFVRLDIPDDHFNDNEDALEGTCTWCDQEYVRKPQHPSRTRSRPKRKPYKRPDECSRYPVPIYEQMPVTYCYCGSDYTAHNRGLLLHHTTKHVAPVVVSGYFQCDHCHVDTFSSRPVLAVHFLCHNNEDRNKSRTYGLTTRMHKQIADDMMEFFGEDAKKGGNLMDLTITSCEDFFLSASKPPTLEPITTETPVSATDSPMAAIDSPMAATDSPMAATDSPMAATDSPKAAIDSPMDATDSQMAAADSPMAATDSPMAATDSPMAATDSAKAASEPPMSVTDSPMETRMAATRTRMAATVPMEEMLNRAKCEICGWMPNYDARHRITHHCNVLLEAPHQCTKCMRTFAATQDLEVHRPCGPRELICPVCAKVSHNIKYNQVHCLANDCHGIGYHGVLRLTKIRDSASTVYRCRHCPLSFLTKTDCQKHKVVHEVSVTGKFVRRGWYPCTLCSFDFTYTHPKALEEHKNFHSDLKCPGCKAQFLDVDSLQIHVQACYTMASIPKQYQLCGFCGVSKQGNCVSTTPSSFFQKTCKYDHRTRKQCRHCKETFPKVVDLMRHLHEVHRERARTRCTHCLAWFPSHFLLMRHLKKVCLKVRGLKYGCRCGARFTTRIKHLRHQYVRHLNKPSPSTTTQTPKQHAGRKRDLENSDVDTTPRKRRKVEEMESKPKTSCCGRKFTSHSLSTHRRVAHRREFRCEECNIQFQTKARFDNHKRVHHSDHLFFKCYICNVQIRSRHAVLTHMMQMHELYYKCNLCRVSFEVAEDYNAHLREHELGSCALCGIPDHPGTQCQIATKSLFIELSNTDDIEDWKRDLHFNGFRCPICYLAVSWQNLNFLEAHFNQHTAGGLSMLCKCELCSFTTTNGHSAVYRHMTAAHQNQFKRCDQCTMTFTHTETLKLHRNYCHLMTPQEKAMAPYIKQFSMCQECNLVFGDTDSAGSHHAHVHASKHNAAYSCPMCKKNFTARPLFLRHLQKHHIQYCCPKCGYFTRAPSSVFRHMVVEHDEMRAMTQCPDCDRKFCTENSLTSHRLNSHPEKITIDGTNFIQCAICGETLTYYNKYMHYQSAHSKERKYKCDECGSSFKFKHHLKNHAKIHRSPQFRCVECDTSFRLKHHLEAHNRSFHGLQGYKCPECGETFKLRWKRTHHRRQEHGATGDSSDDSDDPSYDKRKVGARLLKNELRVRRASRRNKKS